MSTYDEDGVVPNALRGGTRMKFTDNIGFTDGVGNPIAYGTKLLRLDQDIILQKWKDGIAEMKERDPETKQLPDPKELNLAIPEAEWELDMNGKPKPPWNLTYCVYLLDVNSGKPFSYVSSTVGAGIAYRELKNMVKNKSLILGIDLLPMVELHFTWWKPKNFAKRQRADFVPMQWLKRDSSGSLVPIVDHLGQPEPVKQITTAVALNDQIPW
jgi:hypothetical protein